MPSLSVNGLRYHFREWGIGTTPVVLLHGFTGAGDSWNTLAELLAADYHLVAPDLLGHGQTESPAHASRYHIDRAAADLAALLGTLSLKRVHLLGYSMGARLALYFALHYPMLIDHLVLESGSPGLATASERAARRTADEALADQIERDGVAAFVEGWEALPLFASQQLLPAPIQAEQRAIRLRNNPLGLANSLRGMGTGAQPSVWDTLQGLQAETLLISGSLDAKFSAIAQQMAASIPRVRLASIPAAGHTPHLEQAAPFGRFIQHELGYRE